MYTILGGNKHKSLRFQDADGNVDELKVIFRKNGRPLQGVIFSEVTSFDIVGMWET